MNIFDKINLDHRRDNRTVDQFAKDIREHTLKEKVASQILKKDIEVQGKIVEVLDYGMGNDGKLITNSKRVNARPDYKFIVDGDEFLFEIKVHSEKYPFMTFKQKDLKTYLSVMGCIVIIRQNGRYIIPPSTIKYILDNIPGKIYKGFSPNDISHRLEKQDIEKLVNEKKISYRKWSKEAQKLIEENMEIFK